MKSEEFRRVEHAIRQADPKCGEDAKVMASAITGEGLIPLTSELWAELAKAAEKTSQGALREIRKLMTTERAEFIRRVRNDEGGSWRYVAGTCYDAWPEARGDWWTPPSNQLIGMALCEVAAELSGEDYMEPPWN